MAITFNGIVGSGVAVPTDDFITITMSSFVPRSSPAVSSNLLIISQALSSAKAVFGVDIVGDSAPSQACYGSLYGIGNQYEQIGGVILAHDLTATPPFYALNHNLEWGVVLHDISIGDTITITFESGSALGWGRATALWVTGVLQSPTPFPVSGGFPAWYAGKDWGWNRFWSLYGGNTATCHDAIPDNNEFMENDPFTFPGDQTWHNAAGGRTIFADVMAFRDSALTSFSWAQMTTDQEYYGDGPDKVTNIQGHGTIGADADSFSPNFGGCFNTLPTFFGNESFPVNGYILQEGDGPAYDNPGACGGPGIWLPTRSRPEHRDGDPLGAPGNTGLNVSAHFRPEEPTPNSAPGSRNGLRMDRARFRPENSETHS